MIYADITKPVDIPNRIATCPDCKDALWIEITEWEPDTGEITEGGFDIYCRREDVDRELHDERWANDWLPIEGKIYQWLLDNVRVADADESDLKVWNEAVLDWQR